MTKTFQVEKLFGFSNFGHWKLFDVCDLTFVISIIQRWIKMAFFRPVYTKSRDADILYAFRFCIDTTFDSRQTCINGTLFRALIVSKW